MSTQRPQRVGDLRDDREVLKFAHASTVHLPEADCPCRSSHYREPMRKEAGVLFDDREICTGCLKSDGGVQR